MFAASLRAGTMTDTNMPPARGASLRLGFRRARRGRVKKGRSQGSAGRRSASCWRGTGAPPLFELLGDGLELLLQDIELALDIADIVIRAERGHAVLRE